MNDINSVEFGEELAQAFPVEEVRFKIYEMAELKTIKAMILTSEEVEKEYKRILMENLKFYMNMKDVINKSHLDEKVSNI